MSVFVGVKFIIVLVQKLNKYLCKNKNKIFVLYIRLPAIVRKLSINDFIKFK